MDPALQDVFRIILEREGYEVEILSNGQELLKNKINPPDLYILDKQLSGVDGLDICRHLKGQSKTREVPVIMISANPSIGHLAIDAGADDYIEKPFDINFFIQKVKHHM